ncbi:MAG: hypothetical protein ACN0LA_15100 [Candidatus Longimicrobiales bacterium M2_2A_002]
MTGDRANGKTELRTGGGWLATWAPRLGGWTGALFGVLTVVAGGSVLLGLRDPGYPAFRPLLIFNTVMGPLYILAGVLVLTRRRAGRLAAGSIGVVNLGVLAAIIVVPDAVARESLAAMAVRTAVWLLIFAVVSAVPGRRNRAPG